MPTHPIRAALAALVLALVAAPAGAAPASEGASEGRPHQRLIPDATFDAAEPAGQAYQVAGCFTDPTGDVRRGTDGPRVQAPEADAVEACIDHTAETLAVSITVPAGTDPRTDPAWRDFGAGAAFGYRAADGSLREVQLSTQGDGRTYQYVVLEGQFAPQPVCQGPASFDAGTYSAAVPVSCAQTPETVEIIPVFQYGRRDAGGPRQDVVPADGAFIAVPRRTPQGAGRVDRLAGGSRVETAIRTSQASFDDGAAGAVVIALADNFPDALVAAPLAVARQAPVLLSPGSGVPRVVLDEVERALGGPGDVILLGGTAALSRAVEGDLRDEGHDVERISGDSRFTTAIAAAEAANPAPAEILLAYGGDFPDALLAGAVAPTLDGVAVLVERGAVPAAVQAYLDDNPQAQTFTVGTVATEAFPDADSFAQASNPADLSGVLLDLYRDVSEVTVASAESFPDGLSGGAYAAARGVPLLLTPRDAATQGLLDRVERKAPLSGITVFGGTAAVSDTPAGQLAAFLR